MQSDSLTNEWIEQRVSDFNQKMIRNGKLCGNANIYYIVSVDRDGHVTDEKFGINMITDQGLANMFKSKFGTGSVGSPGLRVGVGDGAFNANYDVAAMTNRLEWCNPLINSTNNLASTRYPTTFDQTTGIISERIYRTAGYLDYNISGWTDDVELTEISVAPFSRPTNDSSNYYWSGIYLSRAEIVDENGDPSPVTKHVNERLQIYVYWVAAFHEDVILNNNTNGLFLVTSPAYFNGTDNVDPLTLFTAGSMGVYSNDTNKYMTVTFGNNQWSYDTTEASECVVTLSNTGSSGIITDSDWYVGYSVMNSGYNRYTQIMKLGPTLDTPEELITTDGYTNDSSSPNLDALFGNTHGETYNTSVGCLPCIDFNLTAVNRYNHQTKDWDIQVPFINAANAWYGNTMRHSVNVWMTNESDVAVNAYVYVNPRTDIPIVSMTTQTAPTRMVAADKYWDPSTWVDINISNIQQAAQTKRYYISIGVNTQAITPKRQQIVHALDIAPITQIENAPTYSDVNTLPYQFKPLFSETYKWILSRQHLLFMTDETTIASSFQLYADDNDSPIDQSVCRFNFGDRIVVANGTVSSSLIIIPDNFRIYDVSQFNTTPTYTDIPIDISMSITSDSALPAYYTKSDHGYIGIWSPSVNEGRIIDVYNETLISMSDVKFFHVQEFTDYVIYMIADSSPARFVVYNIKTSSIYDTFDLDASYTNIRGVYGCNGYFFIRNYHGTDDWTLIVYDIDAKSYSVQRDTTGGLPVLTCQNTVNRSSTYRQNIIRNAQDQQTILYDQDCIIVKATDEYARITNINTNLFGRPYIVSAGYSAYVGLGSQLYRTNSDQLYLLDIGSGYNNATSGGYQKILIDIGQRLDQESVLPSEYDHFVSETVQYCGMAYYGDGAIIIQPSGEMKWVPIDMFLPHQIVGTTNTINAYNNPLNMTMSYNWNFTFTNRADRFSPTT